VSFPAAVPIVAVIDESYNSRSNITILSPLFSVFETNEFKGVENAD